MNIIKGSVTAHLVRNVLFQLSNLTVMTALNIAESYAVLCELIGGFDKMLLGVSFLLIIGVKVTPLRCSAMSKRLCVKLFTV